MKFLALEKEIAPIPPEIREEILFQEAAMVLELYGKGIVREIYFNEEHCAVIVLECVSLDDARAELSSLPLVKQNYISFEMMQLNPYTGFSRLMPNNQ